MLSTNIIINEDSSVEFSFSGEKGEIKKRIHELLVCRKQTHTFLNFYNFNNLKNSKNIRIFISRKHGEDILEIKISIHLQKAINAYLKSNLLDERKDLDCMGFCQEILDLNNNEEMDIIHQKDIISGDILFLENNTPGGHHFAIYIGEGYFLSRIGYGGIITIATAEQLEEIFSSQYSKILRKKTTT